jgi:nucleoside-diphosphate-sugar epimerase
MKWQNVLVTGAGGLLGQAILQELSGKTRVAGFDLRARVTDIEWHTEDITDGGALARAVAGRDAIVHVAAIPNIWSGPGETILHVNVVGTWQLLAAAEQAGVKRVVICSSDSVVGFTVREGAMIPPRYLPIDDLHPLTPTDPYGLSKLMTEEAGRSFALRSNLEVAVLRPVFIAYPVMYGEIRARSEAPDSYRGPMVGGPSAAGGGAVWHHVDPRDAARAFRLALDMPHLVFDRFFVSANVTLSPEPTLARLRRGLGYLPEVRDPALYKHAPFAPLYDLRRSREVLGFDAAFDARSVSVPHPLEHGEA